MTTAPPHRDGFPLPEHDHVACRDATLNRAREAFEHRGLKLTELRAQVFGEIAASHHAIGAYDIIDRLARKGTRIAPISVYRAIEVLLDAGVVHRLESRNAFFACHAVHSAGRQHVILVCATCGIVAEVAAGAIFDAIDSAALAVRFEPQTRMVEVSGRCAHCRETGTAAP